jgi:putative ABC transport system permease protein
MFNLLSTNMAELTSSFGKEYNQEDASFMTDKKLDNIEVLELKLNIPAIIEGKALKAGDILIDPAYAKANEIKVGNSIKIYNKNFIVSGFMSQPNYISIENGSRYNE